MEVYLIRHGQTAANRERRYVGRGDEPLTAEGESALRQLGACAEAKVVFASPLQRAVQTARLLFPQARLILLPGLSEMDFGAFEGRTAEEMRQNSAYSAWLESGCLSACPGGESLAGFGERACAAFAQALEICLKEQEPRLFVVAHGGTLMSVLSRWARPERAYFEWRVEPGRGYRALLEERAWQEKPALTAYTLWEGFI